MWVNFIKLYIDAYKLRNIRGPFPVPVLGNLNDKMALTSVSSGGGVWSVWSRHSPGGR